MYKIFYRKFFFYKELLTFSSVMYNDAGFLKRFDINLYVSSYSSLLQSILFTNLW